ncbi:MAG: amidohydrolase family protein, partial [Thermoanaerobaculia bacterium]
MSVVFSGGRVIDPASGTDRVTDVVIKHGVVVGVGDGLAGTVVVDCAGLVVAPGFIDLHTHLREPGREGDETIETGCRAAALGGFTAVCAMPNTEPCTDSASVVTMVAARGREVGLADVFPIGAVTLGRAGERLAPMAEMAAAGCRIFSDDGDPVATAELMRRALEYASIFDAVIC